MDSAAKESDNSPSHETNGPPVLGQDVSPSDGTVPAPTMPRVNGTDNTAKNELRPLTPKAANGGLGTIDPDDNKPISSRCSGVCLKTLLKDNALVLLTLLGVVLGVCFGFALREAHPSDDVLMWIGLPGELFLRALKATIVPLVVSMIISCTATLDPKSNGKIAIVGSLGFLLTQLITAAIAVCLFFIFTPGSDSDSSQESSEFNTDLKTQDVFADLIRNIFPDNVVSATFRQVSTVYETKLRNVSIRNESSPTNFTNYTVYTRHRGLDTAGGTNILGLITVSAAVGIASSRILTPDSEFLTFFRQAQQVVFVIIRWLFWTTPFGVFSLITVSIAAVEDIEDVFYRLGMLVASTVIGLVFYLAVVVPVILFLFTRRNPYVFLSRCVRPFVIGFASTATSVALPEMMTSCDRNDVNPKVSSFVIPMSITLHADGSSLYITAASLFVAESSGMGLGAENIIIIGVMAGILSLAIPPVPSASIVTVVIILTALNYPLHDVALLFAVEWLLDRLRSGTTAIGHVVVAGITDVICSQSMGVADKTVSMDIHEPAAAESEASYDALENGQTRNTHL